MGNEAEQWRIAVWQLIFTLLTRIIGTDEWVYYEGLALRRSSAVDGRKVIHLIAECLCWETCRFSRGPVASLMEKCTLHPICDTFIQFNNNPFSSVKWSHYPDPPIDKLGNGRAETSDYSYPRNHKSNNNAFVGWFYLAIPPRHSFLIFPHILVDANGSEVE